MRNYNYFFIAIVLISALGQISSDLYLPSLPALTQSLNTNPHLSKLTVTMFMLGLVCSSLVYGPVSDGIGRKKSLLAGLIFCLIGSILCAIANNIHFLIAARLIQGIGAGAGTTLFRSMLRDLYEGEKLAKYGSYAALISVGAVAIAPLLGGYIQQYLGWRANFFFLSLCTLVALVYVIFILPETNQHLHPENLKLRKIKSNLLTLITHPLFIGYGLLNFLAYGTLIAWVTTGPFLLQRLLGFTPVAFGWTYALTGLGFALGALTNSRFVARLGIQRMLTTGIYCLLSSGILMLIFGLIGYVNAVVIVGPVILLLFSIPLVFNNAFACAFNTIPTIAGIAGSVFGAMTNLGGALMSSLIAFGTEKNQIPLALTITLCALMAIGIYFGFTARAQCSK